MSPRFAIVFATVGLLVLLDGMVTHYLTSNYPDRVVEVNPLPSRLFAVDVTWSSIVRLFAGAFTLWALWMGYQKSGSRPRQRSFIWMVAGSTIALESLAVVVNVGVSSALAEGFG